MNTTKIERKEKAIELMKKLDIYKPYIKGFKENDEVCFFEGFGGFWAWQDEGLQSKIKKLEEKYDCTVYAVTHEFTEFVFILEFVSSSPDAKWNIILLYLCSIFGSILISINSKKILVIYMSSSSSLITLNSHDDVSIVSTFSSLFQIKKSSTIEL